jgi:hypothetical protein
MQTREATMGRRVFQAMAISVMMMFLFVWLFATALHRPQPHDLRVGIVGPETMIETVMAGAEANAPGTFVFTSYPSADEARSAIKERDMDGALIIGSSEPQILVAGASGQAASGAIVGAFTAMAEAFGLSPTVEDVQPLPDSDSRGLVPFFLVLGVSVSAFLFQVLAREQMRRSGLMVTAVSLAGFAVFGGLVAALAVGVAVGFASGYWALAGVCALLALAVAAATAACCRLFGRAGIGVAGLIIVLLGNASSGSVIGASFLPQPFRSLSPVLPAGSGLEAVRSVLYFEGAGVGWPLGILALWVAGSFVVLAGTALWQTRAGRPMEVPA